MNSLWAEPSYYSKNYESWERMVKATGLKIYIPATTFSGNINKNGAIKIALDRFGNHKGYFNSNKSEGMLYD